MLICQWHLDVQFGKQTAVLDLMRKWLADGIKDSEFRRSKQNRVLVGHIGRSPSHIIAEHAFESLADWEAALSGMSSPEFRKHSEALAPYVVGGSQHWEILRAID